MTVFPCSKINLGLNIVSKRSDGYHNLETVFYPIPLCDALEVKRMDDDFISETACDLKITGNAIECSEADNLVVKAYHLLAQEYSLPRIHIHLYKNIPSQAGLGGGSSDAAYMIRLLDERFRLNLGLAEMERLAARLGADCPFFITASPVFATGIGDILEPIAKDEDFLHGYHILIVKPDIAVSTQEAFRNISVSTPKKSIKEIVRQPIETWKNELVNDFELTVFGVHQEIGAIKQKLYDVGAVYAQMSGTGSAVYGLFAELPQDVHSIFPNDFIFAHKL